MKKKLEIYLELIEFKAKLAGVMPFLLGLMYSYYNYGKINFINTVILLVSIFLFNCAVDIIDNYCDYNNASELHDYKEKVNIIGRENLNLNKIKKIIFTLVIISAFLGLYLSYKTSMWLLIIMLYSFFVGIFYSYGPKPISSLPFGEFFSGTTMGFVIIIVTAVVNIGGFQLFDYNSTINIIIFSIPSVFSIAALMLTNNLCDIEEDKINGRNTLAVIIGLENSIKLLYIFYSIALFGIIIVTILRLVPVFYIISILCFKKVFINARRIEKLPIKSKSFKYAVKNLAFIMIFQVVGLLVGLLINI